MQKTQNSTHTSKDQEEIQISLFETEVLEGLQSTPKTLPSKYFYDRKGDALFQQIMQLDEYYLTRAELEVLQQNAAELLSLFSPNNEEFRLIELGAGDGMKTKVLLREFSDAKAHFTYVPLDISENAVNLLANSLQKELPELKIKPLCADYFLGLEQLSAQSATRKVVLFLGSSVGNMTNEQATQFFQELSAHLRPGDLLLTGFDLAKDPEKILAAYNDSSGVTAAFNLNLLSRINSELDADFTLENFQHFALYDPIKTEARSYLISKKEHQVLFPNSGVTISFNAWEAIHTEISRKYTMATTNKLAASAGFEVAAKFTDKHNRFLDALWVKK